tara:strand:- start:496 stop:846 length:351 start_codon:yes stop_codon:yes gene_type:complete
MRYIEKQERPWGLFYVIHVEDEYKLKRIEVRPNKRLSYQYHEKREESWTIVKGSGIVTINDKEKKVKTGDVIKLLIKDKHRIFNSGDSDLVFIEVQTGSYFGEDDIVRIEDDYKRI